METYEENTRVYSIPLDVIRSALWTGNGAFGQ